MKKEKKGQQFIKKPYYEGGMSAMKAFIKRHLSYPEKAKAKKVEGTVYVRYTINYKGKVIDTKIISGIGHGCDEEAIRLVTLLEFNVPRNRNLKAVFHKSLQIHFRLPIEKVPPVETALPTSGLQYHYTTTTASEVKQKASKTKISYTIVINS